MVGLTSSARPARWRVACGSLEGSRQIEAEATAVFYMAIATPLAFLVAGLRTSVPASPDAVAHRSGLAAGF